MCSEEIDEMIKYTSHVHNVFNTLTENWRKADSDYILKAYGPIIICPDLLVSNLVRGGKKSYAKS